MNSGDRYNNDTFTENYDRQASFCYHSHMSHFICGSPSGASDVPASRLNPCLCACCSGGECGLVYNARFRMPKPPGPSRVQGGYIKRNNAPGSFVGPDIIPLWCACPNYLVTSLQLAGILHDHLIPQCARVS